MTCAVIPDSIAALGSCPKDIAELDSAPRCDLCQTDARVTQFLCRPCLEMMRRVAEAEANIVRELEQELRWAQAVQDQEHMHNLQNRLRAHGVAIK